MNSRTSILSSRTLLLLCAVTGMTVAAAPVVGAADTALTYGVMDPARLRVAYAGTELFRYEIAYTGGIKLGELDLELRAVAGEKEQFELYALVTTEGSVFNTLYPVRDIHLTRVGGSERYPLFYEVWQKEGFNYRAHKVTEYDQKNGKIRYRKTK